MYDMILKLYDMILKLPLAFLNYYLIHFVTLGT